MRSLALAFAVFAVSCGNGPLPLKIIPDAMLPPPKTSVTPPPGPFNDTVTLTFTTDRAANVFLTTDGSDPRTDSKNRQSGPSPFQVTLSATSTVTYFSSVEGKDEELNTGTWTRAGGPVGTITGVVVVGTFAINKAIGVADNLNLKMLTPPTAPAEIPFQFTGVTNGTHGLVALMDRNGDGQLIPVVDFESNTVTVQIDLTDPFKASAENVRLYLGASEDGLGTLRGTITLPDPMFGANLQVSALSATSFLAGFDPQTLLTQLQSGYQIFTNNTDTAYPYVITNLMPGAYVPAPVLLGFGAGGLALNFIANPLQPANVPAGGEAVADFAFGPVSLSGTVTLHPVTAPTGVTYGVVAARNSSFTDGIQAVLMPTIFAPNGMTGDYVGNYAGQALRSNVTFDIRTFTTDSSMNPLTDALAWVVNPFATQPPDITLPVGSANIVQDLIVP